MLLTITTTHTPATDLGYLLHKNPAQTQSFDLPWGKAHIFYPEAESSRCTAALLLDIDPIGLVRGRQPGEGGLLADYVNDRPYVASSFLSVAIGAVFGSALAGRSRERVELAQTSLPLEATIAVVPCRGGEELLHRLFEPLGYDVGVQAHPLDSHFPDWGQSSYYTLSLKGTVRLRDLLSHLYVLIPVLDDKKHYWVGDAEVEKLLRHGTGWLAQHPAREMISVRYLKHRGGLIRDALARLSESDPETEENTDIQTSEEGDLEKPVSLNTQRITAVVNALKEAGAHRVTDLGCGDGNLLRALLAERSFTEILGLDVSCRALEIASDRLHLDRLAPSARERLKLIHGSLIYRDKRLRDFDAAAVVEVIEHLDPQRLAAFARVLFEYARPGTVVLTTPNIEYNRLFPDLPAGRLRHRDHRFEWTRREFQDWAGTQAERFGYTVSFASIGTIDPEASAPTQMAVFRL
jgi:3' terminal RNA ribose 2'-O-methyltransferase Hen1